MANELKDLLIYFAEVKDTYDPLGADRVRTRIQDLDHKYDPDQPEAGNYPFATPLLPKHLHVKPQVGERVLVLFQRMGADESNRFYIGPLISQPYFMEWERDGDQQAVLEGSSATPARQHPNMDPENEGVLPENKDISLEGHKNTELVLKDNEVRLRCGYKETPDAQKGEHKLHRNRTDQGYIQMKFDKDNRNHTDRDKAYASSINIVADRINILSHDSVDAFDLNDSKSLITDDTMSKILKEAHPTVYGDLLIKYIESLVNVFRTHTHPFSMDPPCLNMADESAINTSQLEGMLSKSIRVS